MVVLEDGFVRNYFATLQPLPCTCLVGPLLIYSSLETTMKKIEIPRLLDLTELLVRKSCLLLGPRQTGKSWLIRRCFPKVFVYNLLESDTFLRLSREPQLIRQELEANPREVVVIDEIQKLPGLLDEVHLMIEESGTRFLLTGSSARKLRRSGTNLLGGRAHLQTLHPLSWRELESSTGKASFKLERALEFGMLPSIYLSDNPKSDLADYAGLYLREEIASEGLVRNIPAFSRFLEVAALSNSQMINYTKIANDAQVSPSTVQEHFQILRDTMIGYDLPGWRQSVRRKGISTAKFYFFDGGVARTLQQRDALSPRTVEYGQAFETFIFHELRCYADYQSQANLAYWKSASGFEVDFIFGDEVAIEVKTTNHVTPDDMRGLCALQEENKLSKYFLVCFEKRRRKVDGITILPWEEFLHELWSDKIFHA